MLCESSTGYMLNCIVQHPEHKPYLWLKKTFGRNYLIPSMVVHLLEPYHGQYYTCYTDSAYTGVSLAEYLLGEKQVKMVGTIKHRRGCVLKS